MTFTIRLSGGAHSVDIDGDTPILWMLRDEFGLTGQNYGRGIAQRGACCFPRRQALALVLAGQLFQQAPISRTYDGGVERMPCTIKVNSRGEKQAPGSWAGRQS